MGAPLNHAHKPERRTIKIDAIHRKMLAIVQKRADITNQELADLIGLSPAACSQRMNALKEAGYFISFHAEVDLERLCEHVLAYVEFTLKSNDPETRARFAAAIEEIPEFMDCLRLSAKSISFPSLVAQASRSWVTCAIGWRPIQTSALPVSTSGLSLIVQNGITDIRYPS
jgi:DNA-binding Lrp family transcriptional regulator